MAKLLSLVSGWQGYLALALVCFLVGIAGTWRVMSWHEQAQKTAIVEREVKLVLGRDQITTNVQLKTGDIILQTVKATNERVREIPQHVTPEIDAQYSVPLGFVRVFNDANHGPIPDSPSSPDAAPSGVPLSDVAQADIENAGILDQCRAQVTGWQDWYEQQKALHK